MGPEPDIAYVLSDQWRNNGGGIYRLRIGCDGTITDEGLVAASKLPYTMTFLPAGSGTQRVLVAARDILSSPATGLDVHLLDWSATPSWVTGADAFGDDEAIVSSAALTADNRYLLVADNSVVLASGGRVAAVEVLASSLRAAQVLEGIEDPSSMVTSPFGAAALVTGTQSDSITVLDYNPSNASAPFTVRGPLSTTSKPQLPADAVMIRRGQLTGRVIIADNLGLRQVQFEKGGGGQRGRALQPRQRHDRHPRRHRRAALAK